VRRRARAERGHAAAVDVERADRVEVEEEPVRGQRGVGDVLREGAVVGDGVEGGRVVFGECGVGVLAVEAFLEAVDPGGVSLVGWIGWEVRWGEKGRRNGKWKMEKKYIVFQLKRPS
jgi:hypothetical protein